MPYKDPEQQREAVRRHRARKKAAAEVKEKRLPPPPPRDELLRILGEQARRGGVVAIRTLLDEYRRDTPEAKSEEKVDELAGRRAARTG